MEVLIRPNSKSATELVARLITDALKAKPDMVLGLATGETMEQLYHRLIEIHNEEGLDFSKVKTFNLDEYVGLAPENKGSYRHYMNFHFFDKINIDKKNTFLPNGCASDLDAECVEYEKKIKEFGGIDLQLLGIGISGHIGFNEPLSALFSRTRVKALCPATLKQNSKYFDNVNKIPKRAFTMGIGTILDAKRILMMATGKKKAEILLKALEGPVTAMVSATALQLHPKTVVVLDEESASMLEGKDYYKWIFDNEPEWEIYR